MTTTKTTIRGLVIAAVLGLSSACAATSPTSDVTSPSSGLSDGTTDEQAPSEAEEDHFVLPEDSYRLELECTRAGALLPC